MGRLKVGLIVDSVYGSKYLKELVSEIEASEQMDLELVIVQEIPKVKGFFERLKNAYQKKGLAYLLGKLLYLIVDFFEKYAITKNKYFYNHYKTYELFGDNKTFFRLKPLISESGFIYRYNEKDIAAIKLLKIDVLIRCGSGILRGDILNASKFGIISFHHGDNKKYRGGPAGFWEVLNKEPSTGFIIQRLNNELDGGDILFRGSFPTQNLFSINQAMIYTKSNIFMILVLNKIASNKELIFLEHSQPYDNKLYREPDLCKALQYLFYIAKSLFFKYIIKKFKKNYEWNVSYLESEWTNTALWRGKIIPNPKNHYLADPFIFSKNDETYIFVEDFDFKKNKGAIRLYRIIKSDPIDLGVIIEENFHMSFPFIFEYNGSFYMCPEVSESNQIRIYKCTEFPKKWELYSIAIDNIRGVDPIIFKKNGLWWLFINTDSSSVNEFCSELSIFYSDCPLSGQWIPHKKNPLIINSNLARNGGFLEKDGKHYRVCQKQGFKIYGESLTIREIAQLDKDDYKEKFCSKILPNFKSNIKGVHHLNSNGKFTVFDFLT